ncbi:MAG: hypothetical protein AAFQ94_30795 [Bacteroidota bacterium]
MLITSITNNVEEAVKGLRSEDQLLIDCLCDMLENVEKQSRISNDNSHAGQLSQHKNVIRRALEHNLQLQ